MKLSEIVKAKQGVDVEFTDLQVDETSRGEKIVRLILKAPLDVVFGRRITDPVTNDTVTLEARDVEVVTLNPQAIEELDRIETEEMKKPEAERVMPFTWIVEGRSGRLRTDAVRLDVSNAQEVWVTKDGFAKFASNARTERQNNRRSNLVGRIRESKTKDEFGGAGLGTKPAATPVAASN